MQLIKPNGAKNPNYAGTRIRQLINFGYLTEAKPDEIFVKHFEDFVSLGNIKTECLVTAESVYKYIQNRNAAKEQLGKIPKQNRHVKAIFSDETYSTFMSIDAACLFFGISRPKIMQSIKKNKAIEVPIRTTVKNDIDSEIKTELVRFI
jgi:hypothetical protein